MIYNAEGEFLKPFIKHNGKIPNAVLSHFQEDLFFVQTETGDLTPSMLIGAFEKIRE